LDPSRAPHVLGTRATRGFVSFCYGCPLQLHLVGVLVKTMRGLARASRAPMLAASCALVGPGCEGRADRSSEACPNLIYWDANLPDASGPLDLRACISGRCVEASVPIERDRVTAAWNNGAQISLEAEAFVGRYVRDSDSVEGLRLEPDAGGIVLLVRVQPNFQLSDGDLGALVVTNEFAEEILNKVHVIQYTRVVFPARFERQNDSACLRAGFFVQADGGVEEDQGDFHCTAEDC
jgi:hypothetical protein